MLTRLVDPTDPSRLFIWTSQQLDTAQESFLHFVAIFDNADFPHMRRRLKKITTANGSEQIDLVGPAVEVQGPVGQVGSGLTGDVIVFDEAFALRPSHMGALVPTLSRGGERSLLFGSSAAIRLGGAAGPAGPWPQGRPGRPGLCRVVRAGFVRPPGVRVAELPAHDGHAGLCAGPRGLIADGEPAGGSPDHLGLPAERAAGDAAAGVRPGAAGLVG